MKLFGKNKETLRIKRVKVARALYADGPGTQEIEVRLMTEDGEILDLQFHHFLAPEFIGQMTDAYESIVPPLARRGNAQASWDGSSNF
jgi:hypothetical protein